MSYEDDVKEPFENIEESVETVREKAFELRQIQRAAERLGLKELANDLELTASDLIESVIEVEASVDRLKETLGLTVAAGDGEQKEVFGAVEG